MSRWPYPVYSSEPTTVLKSKFQGHASYCPPSIATPNSDDLSRLLEAISETNSSVKRATHCMYAWRVRSPISTEATAHSSKRAVQSTASSKSASILSGSDDGNEAGAGERLSRLLALGQYENVIIIVHRWYGGVQLGSDRWKCISGAAKEALRLGGFPRGGEQAASPSAGPKSSSKGKKGKKSR